MKPESLPMRLAYRYRESEVGERVVLDVRGVDRDRTLDLVVGAGFTDVVISARGDSAEATRARTLPDTVGPQMRVLCCGLNPSVYAADAGVGYARPGNRFWPALVESGLVTLDRDAFDAYESHRIGLTDLAKRATPRADELSPDEYRDGAARVERLVRWLRPSVVCFVGLAGYRVAIDRKAAVGWQDTGFGDAPTYVMPSTSGLNAHTKPADFVAHFRALA